MICFGPLTFLQILIERSILCCSLSGPIKLCKCSIQRLGKLNIHQVNDMHLQFIFSFVQFQMLESDLSRLLEACHISKTDEEKLQKVLTLNLWPQLQKILMEMLKEARSTGNANKFGKLKYLYRKSLKSTSLSELDAMHVLWTSEP